MRPGGWAASLILLFCAFVLLLVLPQVGVVRRTSLPSVGAAPSVAPPTRSPAPAPSASMASPEVTSSIPAADCVDRPLGPATYLANVRSKETPRAFGPTFYTIGAPDEPPSARRPAAGSTLATLWGRACLDPEFARAVVGAFDPGWPGLARPFSDEVTWRAGLRRLRFDLGVQWDRATTILRQAPPTAWTLAMVPNLAGVPETVIVPSGRSGWYLAIPVGTRSQEFRLICGGQPALDLTGFHAPLRAIYRTG